MTESMGSICTKSNDTFPKKQYMQKLPTKEENIVVETLERRKSVIDKMVEEEEEEGKTSVLLPFPHPQTLTYGKEKESLFKVEDYTYVEEHVRKAPKGLLLVPYKQVVSHLLSNASWDEIARVRAIFLWITSFDIYNLQTSDKPPYDSALQYMEKIKRNMGSHAHLFYGLCQKAYITCAIINGMTKNSAYETGEKVDRVKMGAQWNAVYVEDSWRFIDVLWASSCISMKKSSNWTLVESDLNIKITEPEEQEEEKCEHHVNEFYFMPNAEEFIYTHFPDEAYWQLLEVPLTVEEFEDHFYVREMFHILGMKVTPESQTKAVLHTSGGHIDICFALTHKDSDHYRFKHMLFKLMDDTSSNSKMNKLLERFVFFEHIPKMIYYSFRFPITGTFKMEIYGLDVRKTDIFELVCSYLIECTSANLNNMPFPDNPQIGWGPGSSIANVGLTPKSHTGAIIVTTDGKVNIHFVLKEGLNTQLYHVLKHTAIDDATLTKYGATWQQDHEVCVSLRLPGFGEYALKLFAQDAAETGDAPNVCNYLIKFDGIDAEGKKFPNIAKGVLGKHCLADMFGVSALKYPGCFIKAKDGHLSVNFHAHEGTELICELHTNDPLAEKTMAVVSKNENGKWTFNMYLPKAGEYSLNIFAKLKNEKIRIHSMHSYLIGSTGKPDFQDVAIHDDDNYQQTVAASETVDTSENEFMIPLRSNITNPKVELYKRNSHVPPKLKEIEIITVDDMQMIQVQLTEFGVYILNLYDTDMKENVRNVARYQINSKRVGEVYSHHLSTILGTLKEHGLESPSYVIPSNVLPTNVLSSNVLSTNVLPNNEISGNVVPNIVLSSNVLSGNVLSGNVLSGNLSNYELSTDVLANSLLSGNIPSNCELSSNQLPRKEPSTNELLGNEQPSKEPSRIELLTNEQLINMLPKKASTRNELLSNAQPSNLPLSNVPPSNVPEKCEPKPVDPIQIKNEIVRLIGQAMDLNHERLLQEAITKYLSTNPPENDPVLEKAYEQMTLIKAKTGLQEASQIRTVHALDIAIKKAEKVNKDHQLDMQIALAIKLRDHLQKIDKVLHAVLHIDQGELKRYTQPPDEIHRVMKATFILLGSKPSEVKEWHDVHALMAKLGKDSLMKKLVCFDPRLVSLAVAEAARKQIKDITRETVKDASEGASAFYYWTVTMIKEVKAFGGTEHQNRKRLNQKNK